MNRFTAASLILMLVGAAARGDVKLPAIFGDHMVVQRAMPVPIWGSADPGEKVLVTASAKQHSTVADEKGSWRVTLDAIESSEPMSITVAGKNSITIDDVLPGEV